MHPCRWLGYWTNKAAGGQLDDATQKLYLGVYAAIVGELRDGRSRLALPVR